MSRFCGRHPVLRDLTFRNPLMYSTQIQRMFAIPFSPLLFAFVGVSLGLRGVVRSGYRGMLLALALFGGYYGLSEYHLSACSIAKNLHTKSQLGYWGI